MGQHSAVQECYFDSVRIFWLDSVGILEDLKRQIPKISRYPEISEVWLFGSMAELRAVPGSDVDILIIIDESDVRMIDRIERFQDLFEPIGIGIDIFPYTHDEEEAKIVQHARKTGICIYKKSRPDTWVNELDNLIDRAQLKRKR